MKKRLLYAMLVAVLVLPLLVSCGGEEEATATVAAATEPPAPTQAPTEPPQPTEDPRMGGKLIFATSADEIHLDPTATTWNTDIMIHNNIYRQLYRVNPDATGLDPDAAESYDVNDEATIWTFHLNPDVTFSDGTPVTAEDVVFSIERGFRDESLWGWIYEEAGLEPGKTTALDDRTVQFELSGSFVPFVSYVSGYWASIFPKAALEAQGEEEFFKKPICSGDWMVKELVQSDHLTIVPNPYALNKSFLDEIEFPVIPDDNTRMLQLQAGDIDVGYIVPPSQIDSINALPGLVVRSYPFAFTEILYTNHAKPPLDDVEFRRALNYAVDRQALIDAVLFGHGTLPGSFLPKGVIYWDETVPGFPYDLEQAKEHLAKSAYADGAEFELWTTTTSATGIEIATALQGMWNQLPGVDVEIVQYEPAVLREKRAAGEHWMFVGGFSSDVADPGQITAWFVTGYVNDNFRHADVSEIKPLTQAANAELDPVKREQMFSEIQYWMQDHALTINLYYTNNEWGMKETVHDLWVNPLLIMNLYEVWIEK